ncbi:hypothetical protein [Streptomyces sp. NBC_00286]|uniref:hypothetical protein n=1 Tax=Streptomyces sp. NBC_00286 TaxID=2975701 RepID=UPI002E295B6F|nr:hypothetical protein [Streptomyces sp. NBC_00286]
MSVSETRPTGSTEPALAIQAAGLARLSAPGRPGAAILAGCAATKRISASGVARDELQEMADAALRNWPLT